MDQTKLVKRFVIGTFVTLYTLVSVISTIHVIDFFELSNPYWLAVTLAIGFEIGAAASLASLVILDKMNKTLVWALFITITLMQMQGNMYYAFTNLADFQSWSELFNLIEEEPLYQKRILSFVSGAILPLVALGFIKSLVDYIKPEREDEDFTPEDSSFNSILDEEPTEEEIKEWANEDDLEKDFNINDNWGDWEDIDLTDEEEQSLVDFVHELNDIDKNLDEVVEEAFTAPEEDVEGISKEQLEQIIEDSGIKEVVDRIKQDFDEEKEAMLNDLKDWDSTLADGLEDEEEWDEDHALDQVMNDMVSDMELDETEEELFDDEDPLLAAKRRLGRERMNQFLNIKRNGDESADQA